VLVEANLFLALDVLVQPTHRSGLMCRVCLMYLARGYPLRTGSAQPADMLVTPDLLVPPDVLVAFMLFWHAASTAV
jgi:hypothetical protein